MRHTHGVLFDVGYTLLDETDRLRATVDYLAREAAIVARPEFAALAHAARCERVLGAYVDACANPRPDEPSLLVCTLDALGLPREESRRIRQLIRWDAVSMTPMPGARECLVALKDAGMKVGILANQPVSARDDLERAGLLDLCDSVWLSDAVGLAKPDPAFFRLALSMWSIPPAHVAYVGDRPDNDVAPAKALGMHTVRLRLGPHATQQPRGGAELPDRAADSLDAVTRHLLSWSRRSAIAHPLPILP